MIEPKTIPCPKCGGSGEVRPGRRMKPRRSLHSWIETACPACYGDKLLTVSRFQLLYPKLSAQAKQLPLLENEVA